MRNIRRVFGSILLIGLAYYYCESMYELDHIMISEIDTSYFGKTT